MVANQPTDQLKHLSFFTFVLLTFFLSDFCLSVFSYVLLSVSPSVPGLSVGLSVGPCIAVLAPRNIRRLGDFSARWVVVVVVVVVVRLVGLSLLRRWNFVIGFNNE